MEFDVAHRARIKHQDPNALSRLPKTGKDCNPIDDDSPVMLVSSPPRDEGKDTLKMKTSSKTVTAMVLPPQTRDYRRVPNHVAKLGDD